MIPNYSELINTLFDTLLIKQSLLRCSSNCIATDTDRDGKITFTEWVNSPARTVLIGVDDNTLAQYWAKFDTANAGYLTDDEATNRLA